LPDYLCSRHDFKRSHEPRSLKGLEERLHHSPAVGKGTDEENRRVYYDRLDFELK